MARAKDVANFFIELANSDKYGDGMTNMRVNKLLYFAQGHYFARTGMPLFEDDFVAWQFGPVIREIYQRYNDFGKNPINDIDDDYSATSFTQDELDLLIDVSREYGKYSTSELVNITHDENSPWAKQYNSTNKSKKISKNQIREYFSSLDKLKTIDDILLHTNIPVYEKADSSGYLILPSDYDGGEYVNAV